MFCGFAVGFFIFCKIFGIDCYENTKRAQNQHPSVAERRGGLCPRFLSSFWGLRRTLRVFRSDFCVAPCGRGRLFAEVHITDMSRGSQGGVDAFRVQRSGRGRAPKISRADVLTYRGRIDFGRIRYRGKRIDCAVRRIVRNARRIKSKLHFFSDIGVALCGFACCVSSFPKKIRPTCRGNSGKIKNVQHVPL